MSKKCLNCIYLIVEKDPNGKQYFDCIKGKHTESMDLEDYFNYSCNYWKLNYKKE